MVPIWGKQANYSPSQFSHQLLSVPHKKPSIVSKLLSYVCLVLQFTVIYHQYYGELARCPQCTRISGSIYSVLLSTQQTICMCLLYLFIIIFSKLKEPFVTGISCNSLSAAKSLFSSHRAIQAWPTLVLQFPPNHHFTGWQGRS